MKDYLKKLNDKQREAAICVDGPLLIIAGAGSGKTATMTSRIAYMVDELKIPAYNILAVTFTNKAAAEMRERVEANVGNCSNMWIKTFHSACLMILRMEYEYLGYEKNFVIYDTSDQKSIIKRILKENKLDKSLELSTVISYISKYKEKELSPDDILCDCEKLYGANKIYMQSIAKVYLEYDKTLKNNNAMDFDDLILNVVKLFSNYPEVLSKYQNRFKYILVDEYQDTNLLQYKIISSLAKKYSNICVVGDDDQCIYEWRGADIRNILEFEKDFPGAKVIKLEQNYRSTANILNAANSVIANNSDRKEKKLWTTAGDGEKVCYKRCDNDSYEAYYVADEIQKEMKANSDRSYSSFAVLYRTNVQSRRFEECFASRGIPYQVLSGFRYYDRKEIKDMLSYLRLILNPHDSESLRRVINEPKRGIGDTTFAKIESYAKLNDLSLFDALNKEEVLDGISAKTANACKNFYNLILSFSVEKDDLSVSELYSALVERTGYVKSLELSNNDENQDKIENILEFNTVILEKEKEMLGDEKLTLEKFLEDISLISDIDNRDENENAVVLMTLHSAKGLEFPVVFMPGMEKGLFPSYRALDSEKGMQEERRLCYVGMTRAREKLYLCSARERLIYGRYEMPLESDFIKEIDKKFIEGTKSYENKSRIESPKRYDEESFISSSSYVSPIKAALKQKNEANNVTKKATLIDVDIKEGDRVLHEKLGNGTIISINGNIITVHFDDCGVKKLAKDIAPMKKL